MRRFVFKLLCFECALILKELEEGLEFANDFDLIFPVREQITDFREPMHFHQGSFRLVFELKHVTFVQHEAACVGILQLVQLG